MFVKAQVCFNIMDLISKAEFTKTVLDLGPCYPKLVGEFIVNLSPSFNNSNSPDYRKVHVFGHYFIFFAFAITIILEDLFQLILENWPVL